MEIPGLIAGPDGAAEAAIWAEVAAALPWLTQPGGPRLRVAEVAGAGYFTGKLSASGHTSLLLNADREVLDAARERLMAESERLIGTVALVLAPIADLTRRWPEGSFDLVLCHRVFDRSYDPRLVLGALTAAVKPGGHLSLAFQDRRGAPHEALRRGDAGGALALLRGEVADPPGLLAEEVTAWLLEAGFQPVRAGAVDAADAGNAVSATAEVSAEITEALRRLDGGEPSARLRHIVARRPAVFPIPL